MIKCECCKIQFQASSSFIVTKIVRQFVDTSVLSKSERLKSWEDFFNKPIIRKRHFFHTYFKLFVLTFPCKQVGPRGKRATNPKTVRFSEGFGVYKTVFSSFICSCICPKMLFCAKREESRERVKYVVPPKKMLLSFSIAHF